jgi:hypothetical protein
MFLYGETQLRFTTQYVLCPTNIISYGKYSLTIKLNLIKKIYFYHDGKVTESYR